MIQSYYHALKSFSARTAAAWNAHQDEIVLPLNVTSHLGGTTKTGMDVLRYRGQSLDIFLSSFPFSSLLTGPPGAGKSFGLLKHAHAQSQYLQDVLWNDGFNLKIDELPLIPVLIDLKLYNGLLENLFDKDLLAYIEELAAAHKIHFLVDSYNESPQQWRQNDHLKNELKAWVNQTEGCKWTIASREENELQRLFDCHFWIEDIDKEYVDKALKERQIDLDHLRGNDTLQLMRRPFFFSCMLKNKLRIDASNTHPAHIIESIFISYEYEIWTTSYLKHYPKLIETLGPIGLATVNNGNEIFSRRELQDRFKETCPRDYPVESVIDQLIASGLILLHDADHCSLYHQSLSEFLAAKEYMRNLNASDPQFTEICKNPRWSEVIPLLTYFLSASQTRQLFMQLLQENMHSAVNCVRFAEFGREELTTMILEILTMSEWSGTDMGLPFRVSEQEIATARYRFEAVFNKLPVTIKHVEHLRKLLQIPFGPAAKKLLEINGEDSLPEIIETACRQPYNYNLGNNCGEAIAPFMNRHWLQYLFEKVQTLECPADVVPSETGIANLVAHGMDALDDEIVLEEFQRITPPNNLLRVGVYEWASDIKHIGRSLDTLRMLRDSIVSGDELAIFPLYLKARHLGWHHPLIDELGTDQLDRFVHTLRRTLKNERLAEWALNLARVLSRPGSNLLARKCVSASQPSRVESIAILSVDENNLNEFWHQFSYLIEDQDYHFQPHEYSQISSFKELDWTGHLSLVPKILERQDARLLVSILGHFSQTGTGHDLSLQWIESMLPWFGYASESDIMVKQYVSSFILENINDDTKQKLSQYQKNDDHPLSIPLNIIFSRNL